jgi:hypothetical protein
MKDYLKNPRFYYFVVPLLAAVWAIAAGAVFYPRAVASWQEKQAEYKTAEEILAQIIAIEPQRLAFKQEKGTSGDFNFTQVINDFTTLFSIPSSNFTLNTRGETKRAGKRAQSTVLSIKTIDIEKLSKFLSAMLIRWPDLQCEIFNLDKLPQGKNSWKVDMTLTYYY